MKKIISTVLCLAMSFTLMTPAFAATPEEFDPQYMPAQYIWTLVGEEAIKEYDAPKSEWESAGYHHAKRAGEVLPVISVAHSSVAMVISGTLSVAKGLVETKLDLSFSEPTVQYNTAPTSAPLEKGESVRAYHVPRYTEYKLVQQQVKVDQTGKSTPVGDPVICYVAKPALPRVEFVYFYE